MHRETYYNEKYERTGTLKSDYRTKYGKFDKSMSSYLCISAKKVRFGSNLNVLGEVPFCSCISTLYSLVKNSIYFLDPYFPYLLSFRMLERLQSFRPKESS
jgi:hypothetical protein